MSGEVAYLDTSAFVKLVSSEPESAALRQALLQWSRRASSVLLRVELVRTIRRANQRAMVATALRQLRSVNLIRLDDAVLGRAAEIDPPELRSLDAIHLAVALSLGDELGAVVAYDERLVRAAQALGLQTASPR
ncbi:MAG: type II toxin-antitoxin system VapC family toxin [Candidatus Dormibacter sp.]